MNHGLLDALLPMAKRLFYLYTAFWAAAPILVLSAGLIKLVRWRESLAGKQLLYTHRGIALVLNARFWGPLALASAGPAVGFLVTGWTRGAAEFRPTWWPAGIPFSVAMALVAIGLAQIGLRIADKAYGRQDLRWMWLSLGGAAGYTFGTYVDPAWWPYPIVIPARTAAAWLLLTPLPVLAALQLLWRRLGRETIIDHVEGNAGFAARGEVANNKDALMTLPIKVSYRGSAQPWKERENGPLGHTTLEFSQDALWTHVLLDGNSGSGKGMGIFGPLMFSLAAGDESGRKYKYVLQDVKGVCAGRDLYEQRLGKKVIAWGAAADGQWPSQRWNPIREALDSNDPIGECLALAALIMPDNGSGNDFIPQAGRPLLATCLASGNYPTIKDLFDDIQARGLVQVVLANDCAPGDILALMGKNMTEWVQGEFKARLGAYADGGWGQKVTSGHDFGLDDFLEVGGYVLSAESINEQKGPLRLMWGMLFRRLLNQRRERNLFMLFDEALGSGKTLSRDALNILREDRVSIWAGVQHLDGLREVYGPTEGEALISSFGSKIWLLHGLSQSDKEALSRSLGKRTEKRSARRHGQSETTYHQGDLLPVNVIGSLARPQKEYWAVFDVISQSTPNPDTKLGLPILAKVVPTTPFLQRKPTREEVEAVASLYEGREPFTAPPLTREVVERVATTIGKPELLNLFPKEDSNGPSGILDSIPFSLQVEDEPKAAETAPPSEDNDKHPWER